MGVQPPLQTPAKPAPRRSTKQAIRRVFRWKTWAPVLRRTFSWKVWATVLRRTFSWKVWAPVLRRVFSWKIWAPIVYGLTAALATILFLLWLGTLGLYRLPFALNQITPLLGGFWTSLEVVAVIIPLGFVIGLLVSWARTSRYGPLRLAGSIYVDFFRSLPPVGLIFFASAIGAVWLAGLVHNPYLLHDISLWLGVIALALHTGAYQAEILRAGILSVPRTQTEAAEAIGMSPARSMFLVVLPQAFRVSLPALGNEFSSSIKDTSLLVVIGWLELTGIAFVLISESYSTYLYGSLVIWVEVAMLYFVLTYLVTRVVRVVEDLSKVPGLEVARS